MRPISTPSASTRLTPDLELRASVDTFEGRTVWHLRYFRKCGSKWLPTHKGIALRPEVLPWLAEALALSQSSPDKRGGC